MTITLHYSVRTTLIYNNTQYSVHFMTSWPISTVLYVIVYMFRHKLYAVISHQITCVESLNRVYLIKKSFHGKQVDPVVI